MSSSRLCWLVCLLGCGEVAATNPFDPAAPRSVQREAAVEGLLVLPAGYDLALLADTVVLLRPLEGGEEQSAPVEDEGGFAFRGLTPGPYRVEPQVGGFEAAPVFFSLAIGESIDLGPIALTPLTEAEQQGRMVGLVERAGATDHAGIIVRIRGTPSVTLTDAAGAFELSLPGRVDPYVLEASSEGYETAQREVLIRAGEETDAGGEALILAAQPGVLRGQVLLDRLDIGENHDRIGVRLARAGAAEAEDTADVGADGVFATQLPAGRWSIEVTLDGFEGATGEAEIAPGGVAIAGPFLLRAQEGRLEGVITLNGREDHTGTRVRSSETGAEAVTDADGAFTLSLVARDHTLQLIPPEGFEVPEAARDLSVEIEPGGEHPLDPIQLEPRRTASLTGRLDSPLPIEDWPERALVAVSGPVQRLGTVVNDPDGGARFEVEGLEPGVYVLNVQVVGHSPVQMPVTVLAEGAEVDLELVPALVRWVGRVLDTDGAPVEGAVVQARRDRIIADSAISDPEGGFSLLLTPENHTLGVTAAGFEPVIEAILSWDEGFSLADPEALHLRALPTANLRGTLSSQLDTVDDWANRAVLTLNSEDGTLQRLRAPLRDGSYAFLGLPPGVYNLGISARGHVLDGVAGLVLEAGENGPVDFHLLPQAADIAGAFRLRARARLVDGGEDHSGIRVRGRIGGTTVFDTETVENGTFTAPVSREDHVLTFSREGYFSSAEVTLSWVPPPEPAEGEEPGEGFFRTAEGQVTGDTVLFELQARDVGALRGRLRSPIQVGDWPGESLVMLRADREQRLAIVSTEGAEGVFEILRLRPGPYRLTVQVRGHELYEEALEIPAEALQLDPIDLRPARVQFAATVVDEEGEGVGGVLVRASRDDIAAGSAITDANGAFALGLTPQTHVLGFSHPDYEPLDQIFVDWAPAGFTVRDAAPLELRLRPPPPSSAVSGRLQSPVPIADWPLRSLVSLSGAEGQRLAVIANGGADGRFGFGAIPPGDYTLAIQVTGHELEIRPLSVGAEDLELPPIQLAPLPVRFSGTVEDPGGDGIEGAVVSARVDELVVDTAITDAAGGFTLQLTPEAHNLSIRRAGFGAIERLALDWNGAFVAEGGGPPFVLRPLGQGRIRVCAILGPAWIPAAERAVLVSLQGGGLARTEPAVAVGQAGDCAQHDQKAEFGGLAPGTYSVQFERPGFGRAVAEVEITAEALEPPEVRLSIALTDLSAASLDLAGVALSGAQLLAAGNLRGADLRGVVLDDAQLGCADLEGVNFGGASLQRADLRGARLAGADLTDASLQEALLHPRTIDLAFQIEDFGAPTLLHNGHAAADGRSLLLTDALEGQTGSTWHAEQQAVGAGFETRFSFRVRAPDPTRGADGFAFVIQTAGTDAIGRGGSGLGYADIPRSLAVEFDTFGGGVGFDHIAVHTRGVDANSSGVGATLGVAEAATLRDGALHDVRVVYEPGTLRIYYDDLAQPALEVDVDLQARGILDAGQAWVGFTAATGGIMESHEIHAWSFGAPLEACADGRRGTDLSRARLVAADLAGAVLSDAPALAGAACGGAAPDVDLEGVSLAQADLSGAAMADLDLSGLDLSGQRAADLSLTGACLRGVNLGRANLEGARLDFADATDATFSNALLTPGASRASARSAVLSGAALNGAVLELTDLRDADLRDANLNNLDALGARMDGIDARDASFINALLGDAELRPDVLPEDCDLADVNALLIAHWSFDGDLRDSGPLGINGGGRSGGVAEYVEGVVGQAARFDGTGYVRANALTQHFESRALTLRFWLRTDTEEPVNLFGVHPADQTNILGVTIQDGHIGAFGPQAPAALSFDAVVNDGEWHLIELVIDVRAITLVVDGRPQTLEFPNPVELEAATLFNIGAEFDGGGAHPNDFLGELDELRVFRPCTAENFAQCSPEALPRACRVTRSSLRGAVLDGANLTAARIDHVDLSDASMRSLVARAVDFVQASLLRADLSFSDLTGASVVESRLQEARLNGAELRESSFLNNEHYLFASFDGANLTGARFEVPIRNQCVGCAASGALGSASWRGAILDRIALRQADLSNVDFSGLSMRGADLTGSGFRRANLDGAVLVGATLDGAGLSGSFDGVNLYEASLRGAFIEGSFLPLDGQAANLSGADLSNADLTDAGIGGANAGGSIWRGATLHSVDLRGAGLVGARFDAALIQERTRFDGADLQGAHFGQTVILRADFRGTDLEDAFFTGALLDPEARRGGLIDFTGAIVGDRPWDDEENALHNVTFPRLTDIRCPDGRDTNSNTGCDKAKGGRSAWAEEGGTRNFFQQQAIVSADPNWTVPGIGLNCALDVDSGSRDFHAIAVYNRRAEPVTLSATVENPVDAAEGFYIHRMEAHWDNSPASGCLYGFVGALPNFTLQPGEAQVIVLTEINAANDKSYTFRVREE